MKEGGEENYLSRLNIIKKLGIYEEELNELQKENRLLKKLVDNLDLELKRYRSKPFLQENFEGVKDFDKELINLLKEGGSYSGEELLSYLHINSSDVDLVKALNRQLEILEAYGLVEYGGRGWKWKQ